MALTEQEARALLAAASAALDAEEALGTEDRRVVELDQTSVGRLSRMDALQRQAMAAARQRRREARRKRIAAALARLDEGEYGFCTDCGDTIAAARLRQDPAVPTCISCARG